MAAEARDLLLELANIGSFRLGAERWRYDWAAIEGELGVRLPGEYKELVQAFPPGAFGELIVFHPARRSGFTGLPDQISGFATMFSGSLSVAPSDIRDSFPFGFYPESGGLIPWAAFNVAAVLCWLPNSEDPDAWPVLAYADDGIYESIDGTTLEALVRVLRGEAGERAFPEALFVETKRYITAVPATVELGMQFNEEH
jgi:hypothetical protein